MSSRKLFKTTIGAVFGASLLATSTAFAADMPTAAPPAAPPAAPVSSWSLAFGTAFMTDYNFRGISQSARRPAVQGTAELAFTLNPNLQFYAAVFGSSLKLPSQASMELDGSIGVRPSFGNLSFDFGATYYGYPGELPGVRSEFWEFYGKASYKFFNRVTIGANVFHAPDWLNLNVKGTYYSGTIAVDLPYNFAVSGEVGRYVLQNLPDYTYWNAGISYTYKVATLDLRYHDTDLNGLNCQALVGQPGVVRSKWCGKSFIATLKFDYSISDLFGANKPVTASY